MALFSKKNSIDDKQVKEALEELETYNYKIKASYDKENGMWYGYHYLPARYCIDMTKVSKNQQKFARTTNKIKKQLKKDIKKGNITKDDIYSTFILGLIDVFGKPLKTEYDVKKEENIYLKKFEEEQQNKNRILNENNERIIQENVDKILSKGYGKIRIPRNPDAISNAALGGLVFGEVGAQLGAIGSRYTTWDYTKLLINNSGLTVKETGQGVIFDEIVNVQQDGQYVNIISKYGNHLVFRSRESKSWVKIINDNCVLKDNSEQSQNSNCVDDLVKLAELYKDGLLTKEEFENKKKELL